jgi:enoyl-CoA hydratase/carnithine racemase
VGREVPPRVIAAVHGAALGAGFQLALAADIRIAAPDAFLGALEVRYGLVPDMSASQVLLKLVRPDVARELLYTGRQVGAEEALRLGLITRIEADPLAAANELAKSIAASSPHAVRAAKALCERAPLLSVADALALEAELQKTLIGSKNQMEAVRAMMMKDTAVFED